MTISIRFTAKMNRLGSLFVVERVTVNHIYLFFNESSFQTTKLKKKKRKNSSYFVNIVVENIYYL